MLEQSVNSGKRVTQQRLVEETFENVSTWLA
jgi:hypothetical protein